MFAHKTGARDPYQTLCTQVFGCCIVWLYYASSSTVWLFPDNFFCLVCGILEKKKLIRPNLACGGAVHSVCVNEDFIASSYDRAMVTGGLVPDSL